MSRIEITQKNLLIYFGATYLVFWSFVGLIGFAIMVLELPAPVISVMKNASAWTPSLMVLVLFKRLMPQLSLRQFLRRELLTPVKKSSIFKILFFMVGILLCSYLLASTFGITDKPFFNEMTIPSLSALFLATLTAGATGEELGWRGYAYNELRKKYQFTSTALLLGLVWGFWHLPLWFLNGFSGVLLVEFILVFLAGIIAHSVIISFFYERSGSLWTAILIHFLYNFLAALTLMEPQNFHFFWPPYIVAALILIVIEKRKPARGGGAD